MVTHERARDTDKAVGNIANAGGIGHLATQPAPAVTVEDQSDNDTDHDENDKRRQRALWHSVLQPRCVPLSGILPDSRPQKSEYSTGD